MLFDTRAFGVRVKMLRIERNLTQEQFAQCINSSVSHLGKIEIGNHSPSIELVLTIAFFFDVSADYLLYGKNTYPTQLKSKIKKIIKDLQEFEEQL